jgi:hypothetical protein
MLVEIFISHRSKLWSSKPIFFLVFCYFIIIYLPDSMYLVECVNMMNMMNKEI